MTLASTYTNIPYVYSGEVPCRKIPILDGIRTLGYALYKPPTNQRKKLMQKYWIVLHISFVRVIWKPRTFLHQSILIWSAQMDDQLTVMLEGNKLKKNHFFATTGDGTSFIGTLNAFYIAITTPNAYANVFFYPLPPPPPESKQYFGI